MKQKCSAAYVCVSCLKGLVETAALLFAVNIVFYGLRDGFAFDAHRFGEMWNAPLGLRYIFSWLPVFFVLAGIVMACGTTLVLDGSTVTVKHPGSNIVYLKRLRYAEILKVVVTRSIYGRRMVFYYETGRIKACPRDTGAVVSLLRKHGVSVEGWPQDKPFV